MKLPRDLESLFWNVDSRKIDPWKSKDEIIKTVLSRGSLEQIKTLFQLYGPDTISLVFRDDVTGNRTLPAPVVYMWSNLFLTPEEFDEYRKWHRHPVRKWEQRRNIG